MSARVPDNEHNALTIFHWGGDRRVQLNKKFPTKFGNFRSNCILPGTFAGQISKLFQALYGSILIARKHLHAKGENFNYEFSSRVNMYVLAAHRVVFGAGWS